MTTFFRLSSAYADSGKTVSTFWRPIHQLKRELSVNTHVIYGQPSPVTLKCTQYGLKIMPARDYMILRSAILELAFPRKISAIFRIVLLHQTRRGWHRVEAILRLWTIRQTDESFWSIRSSGRGYLSHLPSVLRSRLDREFPTRALFGC